MPDPVSVSADDDLCLAIPDISMFTGQFCCNDSNCISGTCTFNTCEWTNQSCVADEECLPNYYCNLYTKVCTKALGRGEICGYDNQCQIGDGCNFQRCTQLFSFCISDKVESPKFCDSKVMINGKCDALQVKVANRALSFPYKCRIGEVCEYSYIYNGTIIDTKPCLCDGVHEDIGYCGEHIEMMLEVAIPLYKRMKYTASACSGNFSHTDDIRTLYDCGSITDNLLSYYENTLLQARNWVLYQSGAIDTCAADLNLFNPAFTLKEYDSFSRIILIYLSALYLF